MKLIITLLAAFTVAITVADQEFAEEGTVELDAKEVESTRKQL